MFNSESKWCPWLLTAEEFESPSVRSSAYVPPTSPPVFTFRSMAPGLTLGTTEPSELDGNPFEFNVDALPSTPSTQRPLSGDHVPLFVFGSDRIDAVEHSLQLLSVTVPCDEKESDASPDAELARSDVPHVVFIEEVLPKDRKNDASFTIRGKVRSRGNRRHRARALRKAPPSSPPFKLISVLPDDALSVVVGHLDAATLARFVVTFRNAPLAMRSDRVWSRHLRKMFEHPEHTSAMPPKSYAKATYRSQVFVPPVRADESESTPPKRMWLVVQDAPVFVPSETFLPITPVIKDAFKQVRLFMRRSHL